MRRVFVVALVVLMAVVALGCESDPAGSTAVTLSGTVIELPDSPTAARVPIGDVEVCQFASNNCAMTNANGEYALRVLRNQELELSYRKAGFGDVLVARRSGNIDFQGNAVMATDDQLSTFADSLNTPYPPQNTGFITATTFQGPVTDGNLLAGVSYSLSGSNGRSFYLSDSGEANTGLLATGVLGTGGFIEVTPFTIELSVSDAANCTSDASWNVAATNTFALPVRAGFWTQTAISCE